jgi:mannose-6-phosphate isomerase-like protein (cupin superfamily)
MLEKMKNKVSLADALKTLGASANEFKVFFSHGTLELELYKPHLTDKQLPHTRDEVYVVATGEAVFELAGEQTTVTTGDFLFVPAQAAHRFVHFSQDFSTWVLFYGPEGGEVA